jgi:adenylate kinase family enzyme
MKFNAVLIFGPTGSGKTPLGDYLETMGFNGQACYHFDFGAQLRFIAEQSPDRFADEEIVFIRNVLTSGALLEDDRFYLIQKIMDDFVHEKGVKDDEVIVLNGMPRHAGQAESVMKFIKIQGVIYLNSPPHVVQQRIMTNIGGDRTNRVDDDLEAIKQKLMIFERRTRPLLDFFASHHIPIWTCPVGLQTTPEAIVSNISKI